MYNGAVADYVAVLVDHRRLVKLTDLRPGSSGRLDLTTILQHQPRAVIELFLVDGQSRKPLHTFETAAYDHTSGRPVIRLKANVNSQLTVTLHIGGMKVDSFVTTVRGSRRWGIVLWLVAVLILVGGTVAALRIWGPWADHKTSAPQSPTHTVPPSETSDPAPEPPALTSTEANGRGYDEPSGSDSSPDQTTSSEVPTATLPTTTDSDAVSTDRTAAEASPAVAVGPFEATVYFRPDSAELTEEALVELNRIAATAMEHGADDERLSVTAMVTGHTAMFPTQAWRQTLSLERARAVSDYLGSAFPNATVRVEGHGSTEPVAFEMDQQWRNRRVAISVTLQPTQP